jgi:hypothetical protein
MGAERPPYGAFQARFCPEGDQEAGKSFSCDTPSRAGPRHSVQSLANVGTKRRNIKLAFKKMDRGFVILNALPRLLKELVIDIKETKNEMSRCNPKDVEYVKLELQ